MRLKTLALGLVLAGRVYAADWMPVQLEALRYPALGYQARIKGIVHLTLTLDDTGSVSVVEVVSGHPILARAAEENIRSWRFASLCAAKPNQLQTLEFTYDFRLEGAVADHPITRFRYEHPNRVIVISPAVQWTPSTQKKSR